MPDVFINYRTGDGEKTALLLEKELSAILGGEERIFRATRSIKPGQRFPEELLGNVRRSTVLLAVIGPNWIQPPDFVTRTTGSAGSSLRRSPSAYRSCRFLKGTGQNGWTGRSCRWSWPGSPRPSRCTWIWRISRRTSRVSSPGSPIGCRRSERRNARPLSLRPWLHHQLGGRRSWHGHPGPRHHHRRCRHRHQRRPRNYSRW